MYFSAGNVTLLEPLDYEAVRNYSLRILAIDQGTPYQWTARNITVNVIDQYDFMPSCQPEVTESNIKSTADIGTPVAQVNAGDGNLRYTLVGKGISTNYSVEIIVIKMPLSSNETVCFSP